MKQLCETIATILFVSFLIFLMVVLRGEPSLLDLWVQAAKGICK